MCGTPRPGKCRAALIMAHAFEGQVGDGSGCYHAKNTAGDRGAQGGVKLGKTGRAVQVGALGRGALVLSTQRDVQLLRYA
jgi:hypothetical protein